MWYSRTIDAADMAQAGFTGLNRLTLRFGAVDYRCQVWVDGQMMGSHVGGHTSFGIDITDALATSDSHRIVLRVEDDPTDITQPRGKQDWRETPHAVWYPRTSGVWQPVWLEAVPDISLDAIDWVTKLESAQVVAHLKLSHRPVMPVPVKVRLMDGADAVAQISTLMSEAETDLPLTLPQLAHGQEHARLLWTPDHPHLLTAQVKVGDDEVTSYLGLRTVAVKYGRFLLNGLPCQIRAVLDQGCWPQSHLAAPSEQALRHDVELIKQLGFNTVRVHQKYEDPRFLYWADRLGLMIWGEAPAAYSFSTSTIQRNTAEWLANVERDRAHPSLIAWVPFNESWGIQAVADNPAMQQYQRGLVALTRALDSTRPVVANDGWEQIDTDIVAIHDYCDTPVEIKARYANQKTVDHMRRGIGPAGRQITIGRGNSQAAVMLTEFGGIAFSDHPSEETWGYAVARSADEFKRLLQNLFAAVQSSPVLAGFCYTQLTDTWQEANGLLRADRTAKLPVDVLRSIVTGQPLPTEEDDITAA